ncbi:MAG: DNA repair protein RecN [Solirubrobacteraceae bacterium]|nr:MAG: DNA repair protein RecN [Solirubrobacterales bacterium]
MLLELRVENLLLIETAELRLDPGLNVITGETGAGKTVLANALDLLLGGRARSGIVRPGAREAYVEGVFERTGDLPEEIAERLPAAAEELVLARRLGAEGRTRAYIGGRGAAVGELQAIGPRMISFYGQHEHRRLTVSAAQLEVLDRFCDEAQGKRRVEVASAHVAVRRLEERVEELRQRAGARERELDLLRFELAEIEDAAPSEAEMMDLSTERARLRNLEALGDASYGAIERLAPDSGGGAADLGAAAAGALQAAAELDGTLLVLAERARALGHEAADIAGELRTYACALDAPSGRLEQVEERLGVLDRLERKHGGSIAAVLEHGEHCRARIAELNGSLEALADANAQLARAQAALSSGAWALREGRTRAAARLAPAVRAELSALAMEGAGFEVRLTPLDEPGPTGADAVEFMLAANPGVPAAPLREVASGGELSRAMLALLGVAGDGGSQTLVFDEIDAGIGGQTARVVGERLRAVATNRQLLCITHLPQVASLAARHFRIAKDSSVSPARAAVTELAGDEVVVELARMLGAGEDDGTARRHAERLRRAA